MDGFNVKVGICGAECCYNYSLDLFCRRKLWNLLKLHLLSETGLGY